MKRVVLAALVAAAGVIAFNAPARAYTTYAATMVNGTAPATYKFAAGTCATQAGPGSFTIQVGDKVTWTNCTGSENQNIPHTVTADDGTSFDTGDVASGTFATLTFNTPGTFPYHCVHHSNMTGTIKVNGEATTTTTHTTPTTQAATTTTKPTTTTTSTTVGPTTTTEDINGVFGEEPSTEPTTTVFSTDTTRALGQGGGNGTSAGVVAALILGLGGIGTAAALVIRRMRSPNAPS